MAEIEAHEFSPRPFSSVYCNECEFGVKHPIHTIGHVLGLKNTVMVDVGSLSDDRRECPHDKFTCSGPRPAVRHSCTECHISWTNSNNPKFKYCDKCRDEQYPIAGKFVTKDSGKRTEYASGMKRDVQGGKPRFDLLLPLGVPHSDQFLTRVAELLARGAEKYDERNWEKASGEAELSGFKASAIRHLFQWLAGETDEDHAAAVVFNLLGAETLKWKMENE